MKLSFLSDINDFDTVEYTEMLSYHWEAPVPYRPRCFFRICRAAGLGIVCDLLAYEEHPLTLCSKRDDPVYTDSCLEFFAQPVVGRSEYINVECNSAGVYLSQFGSSREGRTYLKELTSLTPDVTPFCGSDSHGKYWGVRIILSYSLLDSLYGCDTSAQTGLSANFYKCGDETEAPHYIAFSPVDKMPPGFHNSKCFYKFD